MAEKEMCFLVAEPAAPPPNRYFSHFVCVGGILGGSSGIGSSIDQSTSRIAAEMGKNVNVRSSVWEVCH